MSTKRTPLSLLLLLAASALTGQTTALNVSGTWAVTRGVGHRLSTLTLHQEGERVDGTWSPENEPSSAIDKGTMHGGTFACLVLRHNIHFLIVGHLQEGRLIIEISRPDTKEIVHAEAKRLSEGDR